jgi:hypothetical protein
VFGQDLSQIAASEQFGYLALVVYEVLFKHYVTRFVDNVAVKIDQVAALVDCLFCFVLKLTVFISGQHWNTFLV